MKVWLVRQLFDEVDICFDKERPILKDTRIYAPFWDYSKYISGSELIPEEIAHKVTFEGGPIRADIEVKLECDQVD